MDDLEARIEELYSRQKIMELSTTYSRAQDRLDPDLQRSVFHDDAWMDYGYFRGGPDEFVAFAQGSLRKCSVTQHLIGQMIIAIEGETAYGEIYNQAFHRMPRDDGEVDLIVAGRYIDKYERRNDVWKIVFRSEVVDWTRTEPADDDFFKRVPNALRTSRDEIDLSDRRHDLRRPDKVEMSS